MKVCWQLLIPILISASSGGNSSQLRGQAESLDKSQQTILFATGYEADSQIFQKLNIIYTEAFKSLGFQFKLIDYPKKRALQSANSGIVDGDASRIKELDESGQFTNLIRLDVVVNQSLQVAYAKDKGISISDWKDIKEKGFVIGYPRGQVYAPSKIAQFQIPDQQVAIADDCKQLVRMLRLGRIDLYVDNIVNCRAHLSQFDDIAVVAVLDKNYSFPYINRRHSDVIPSLETALKNVLSDPSIKQRLSKLEQ